MLSSLPLFHQIRGRRVVLIGTGEIAEAKKRLIERAGGVICSEAEAHHAKLGFVALPDVREAEMAANRLRTKGLLVNVADRPELCDFTLPSIIDRDPVVIAIGTAGTSAGLAKHLRLRLERILPQGLGRLAASLAAAREQIRRLWPKAGDRRSALDDALRENGRLDPMRDHGADIVKQWLAEEVTSGQSSAQVEIRLTSQDPDDLTLRQARWLGMADTLLYDAAVPPAILDRARADATRQIISDDSVAAQELPGLTVIVQIDGNAQPPSD